MKKELKRIPLGYSGSLNRYGWIILSSSLRHAFRLAVQYISHNQLERWTCGNFIPLITLHFTLPSI